MPQFFFIRCVITLYFNKVKCIFKKMNDIISQIVAGLMGGGLCTSLLALINWRANKKKNVAEAEKAEAEADGEAQNNLVQINEEWEKLVNRKDQDIAHLEERLSFLERGKDEKDAQITQLYQTIGALRDESTTIREERSALKVEIERMKPMICEVRKCASRKPQSNY